MFLQIQSETKDLLQLTDYAENVFREIKNVPGVSGVNLAGAMPWLWIDPAQLMHKLTIADIKAALDRENIELPGGKIRGNETHSSSDLWELTTEDDLIISSSAKTTTVLFDLKMWVTQHWDWIMKKHCPENNVPTVNMGIVAQPGSNQIEIVDEAYRRLEQIKRICRRISY
jgi:multidrug efflux pump